MEIRSAPAEHWKPVLQLALAFAAIKLAIEFAGNLVAQHFGYGIFRDEMYYIVCGRRLAWGYVDQAPMVALQARVAEMLFGFHHLAFLRLFSALAGAAKIFLTGILAWLLGGRRARLAADVFLFAQNGMAGPSMVRGDAGSWRNRASHGDSGAAAIHVDPVHAGAPHDA